MNEQPPCPRCGKGPFDSLSDWLDHDCETSPTLVKVPNLITRVDAAVTMAVMYGGIDGAHHKDWVIDQMVRILTGDQYEQTIENAKAGEDGPDTYSWDVGIAP